MKLCNCSVDLINWFCVWARKRLAFHEKGEKEFFFSSLFFGQIVHFLEGKIETFAHYGLRFLMSYLDNE